MANLEKLKRRNTLGTPPPFAEARSSLWRREMDAPFMTRNAPDSRNAYKGKLISDWRLLQTAPRSPARKEPAVPGAVRAAHHRTRHADRSDPRRAPRWRTSPTARRRVSQRAPIRVLVSVPCLPLPAARSRLLLGSPCLHPPCQRVVTHQVNESARVPAKHRKWDGRKSVRVRTPDRFADGH